MVRALQILCLVSGLSLLVKRPKIKALSSSQFPNVPMEAFDDWKRHEMKSLNLFLWAGWGLLLLSIPAELVVTLVWPSGLLALGIVLGVMFLTVLVSSAISGTEAAKINKRFGFKTPKW